MSSNALKALTDELAAKGSANAADALRLRREVFPDGVISRDEAEALIALEARVANSDSAWTQCFTEAICDHVLENGAQPNVNAAAAVWLINCFSKDAPRETELRALLKLVEHADSVPDSLVVFLRARLGAFVKGRPLGPSDVEMIRHCLYAGDVFVNEDEARWLFALDAESDGRANDPAWGDLFVKAQLNHLMGAQAPALLDAESMRARQAWLEDTSRKPVSNLAHIFSGGLKGYIEHVREPGMSEALEEDYAALNANSEEDAQLTPQERAWALGMSQQDGKLSANERALMAELQKIESPRG